MLASTVQMFRDSYVIALCTYTMFPCRILASLAWKRCALEWLFKQTCVHRLSPGSVNTVTLSSL